MAIGVMTRIEDLKTVLGQTQDHRHRVLVAAAKNIRMWFTKVRKIKSIYHTLNLFNLDVTQKCLIAECWCPTSDMDKIQLALKRGTVRTLIRVCSRYMSMFTGGKREHGAVDLEPDGHGRAAAHLPPREQIHQRIPEHCRLVRHSHISRGESR